MLAGCTAAIAWLLDPAIEKMFIEQDKMMMVLIPIAIVFAFAGKGLSLNLARIVLINVGNEIISSQIHFSRSVCRRLERNLKYGIASICIGGGEASAMLIERI